MLQPQFTLPGEEPSAEFRRHVRVCASDDRQGSVTEERRQDASRRARHRPSQWTAGAVERAHGHDSASGPASAQSARVVLSRRRFDL